ncbi:hypothetical protein Sfulv_34290 [Streptomyces fulvorobeus]|uniref:Uncharacterized protein n=1 Tax=Streptomyces fulvorobeus TaxID=284028 RepID=A0A7J0C8C8_9ACTN|nr:hypothetical protein Sfulv_34290 [Streptomyces fulvorobeus]
MIRAAARRTTPCRVSGRGAGRGGGRDGEGPPGGTVGAASGGAHAVGTPRIARQFSGPETARNRVRDASGLGHAGGRGTGHRTGYGLVWDTQVGGERRRG